MFDAIVKTVQLETTIMNDWKNNTVKQPLRKIIVENKKRK